MLTALLNRERAFPWGSNRKEATTLPHAPQNALSLPDSDRRRKFL